MKRYQITVGGRTFDVEVLSDPRQPEVEIQIDGQVMTVVIATPPAGGEAVQGEVSPIKAVAPAEAADWSPAPSDIVVTSNDQVAAPLPGVVKSIAVQPGQQVVPGDELVVIEAMKMDNIIRASRPGTVETIHIAEGHRIAYGQLMLEYRA